MHLDGDSLSAVSTGVVTQTLLQLAARHYRHFLRKSLPTASMEHARDDTNNQNDAGVEPPEAEPSVYDAWFDEEMGFPYDEFLAEGVDRQNALKRFATKLDDLLRFMEVEPVGTKHIHTAHELALYMAFKAIEPPSSINASFAIGDLWALLLFALQGNTGARQKLHYLHNIPLSTIRDRLEGIRGAGADDEQLGVQALHGRE